MLCAYFTGTRWRWLTTHPSVKRSDLLLVEREGACPGDPDGSIVTVTGGLQPDDLPGAVRAWLGTRGRQDDHGATSRTRRLPRPKLPGLTWEPGDRRIDETRARRAVGAAVNGAATGFCVFGNPAAHQH